MLRVILAVKVTLDDGGNAAGGPKLVGPAVVLGSFQQELLQLGQLLVAEAGRRSLVRLGVEPSFSSRQPTPRVDGGVMHAEDARYRAGRFASLYQLHGPAPPPFQFRCCPYWSCHTSLYRRSESQTSYGHAGLSRTSWTLP